MRQKAHTIVEIIFYFAILGVLLFAAMNFAIQIMNISSLSSNMHELNANADLVTQEIVYTIQTADMVNDAGSAFDVDNGALSLNADPLLIYLEDGDVFMKKGITDPVQLNTDFIQFDYLRFHKISADKAPDQIVIEALLSTTGVDISNLEASYPIQVSVSLRK
jgi:hypothetical protein